MDKMEAHLRQQLSAMMDGELASDEARFLFRRLQHDRELASCWERWQVGSALMRGQGAALLPADFSQRVAQALALESAPAVVDGNAGAATGTHPRRWAWWGGGAALAASLALLVVVPRPASGPTPAADNDPQLATATTLPAAPAPKPSTVDASRSPSTPPAAAQLATALAMAEAPRRVAARRSRAASPESGRSQPQSPRAVRTVDSGQRIAASEPIKLPTRSNPFAQEPASRPWPRAVLPGANAGAFTASYSTDTTGAFYPFGPRNLPMAEAQIPAGDGQR